MAKLFNPGNFSQQFGESFIRTLEMERKMRQDQEQFNRKMQFENRQLDFDISRNKAYQEYLNSTNQRQGGEFFLENFQKAPEGLSPDIQRYKDTELESIFKGNDFPEGEYYQPSMLPTAPKEVKGLLKSEIENGMKVDYYGYDRGDNDLITDKKYHNLPKSTKSTKTAENDYEEPKLTEAGAKGLAWLRSPNFTRTNGQNVVALTKSETANKFSESITSLAKDVLKSRTYKWFNTMLDEYKKQGRIPTVAELDDRIVEHYEKYKTLNDTDVEELNILMNYLSEADESIQSIYDKTK